MSAIEAQRSSGRRASWLRRHRRALLLGGALSLLLIAVVVGAAATWYFSSAVVTPDHVSWPLDATVKRISRDQVVLSRSKDTLRVGVYGADWPKGHAILGPVLGVGVDTVTRRLSSLRGRLSPGTRIAMDPNVYSGNPQSALELAFSRVSVPDQLGGMPAWLIPAKAKSDVWSIVVHGINGSRQDDLRIVPSLHRFGSPTLLITYREDVGAPSSPDGKHHMGLTEWRDLQAAARYALSHGAKRLVLVGYSMGGAIVTQFMERSPLARDVVGLVLDAPALDWRAILSFNAKELGLPSFMATPVEWMVGLRIDADWSRLDALRHTASFHLPILLFHGMADKLVPISTSDAFAKKLGRWVTYYRVPKAAHVHSWNVDPSLYERRVMKFLAGIGLVAGRRCSLRGVRLAFQGRSW